MNKNLQSFLINGLSLFFCIGSLLSVNVANAQLTTLFTDYFNRAAISPGGTPSTTYVSTIGVGGTGSIATAATATAPATINDFNGENDYRLKLNGASSTSTDFLMSSMLGIAGYNAILNQNTQPITWSFNIRHNRNQSSMSGFAPGKYGVAAIIACDKANPTDLAAKGYALVMGNVAGVPGSTYDLVSFTGGILDIGSVATGYTATTTAIITGIPASTGIRDVLSVKITYNPTNNSWRMLQKWDPSPATVALYNDPAFASTVCGAGETADQANFVASSLPNFGFLLNHGGTAATTVSLTLDHFKVVKGTPSATSFYLAANSDCTNLLNWGTNTDGTGTPPGSFTDDYQTFKIYNSGAFIGTDWLVSGSASSVVLGDGTNANALIFPSTASYTGVLDISANTNLTVSSLTSNFTINSIDSNSTVTFDGADSQDVPAAAYGNLNILTQGTVGAKAAGVIAVNGTFNIAAGSILNMDSSKLANVNLLAGSGTLKTKNPNSTALPAGINWPFDIYYNYTSANGTQSIAGGNYTNINTTGAATGSPRVFNSDFTVSGSFTTGLGVMTAAATTRMTFNGVGAQAIPSNFPPAAALIIANTSASGVSLSADEIIPDVTNLELAGNLNADFNENFGTLSLLDNSILTLGATDHFVAFTNSSAINPGPADFWIAGKTLTVKGWTGTPGNSGTNGKLFVGVNETTGLSAIQLSQITFEGFSGAMILTSGEVVPVSFMGVSAQTFKNFKYSPNPVANKLMLSNAKEISEVSVYNFIGQKVLVTSPNALISDVDMSGLANSVYLVEVISEGNKQTFKVIKE